MTSQLDEYGVPVVEKPVWKKEEKVEMSMWTKLKNRGNTIYLPEILKAASDEELFEDRVKMLLLWIKRESKNLELYVKFVESVYDPRVVFDLPATRPPFTTNGAVDFGKAPNTLYKAIRRIQYFAECQNKITNRTKREGVFIRELESMYKDEAELFLMIVSKKIDNKIYPNITEDLFRAVMPKLFPAKV